MTADISYVSYYEKFTLSGEVKCIDEEIPFEIPNGWVWCRLGNIVDFSTNLSVKSNAIPPDAWLLDLEDIEKETGKILQKKRYIDVISKSDKHKFFSDNILYSKLRPYLNKVVLADEEGFCTSEILVFDFNLIYNKYALWYLRSPFFVEYAMKDAYGVKMPRLGSNQGNMSLFPIPPLTEQQRIVEKIEELIPHIEHYGKAQTELDTLNKNIKEQLKKSVLQYAIEGKLVPQDEAEGTAEELLLQIQAEKLKLYKENKLKKKDLEYSTIFKDEDNKYYEKIGKNVTCIDEEIPFEIPKNWRWCRLGVLTIFLSRGKSPKYSEIKKYPVFAQKCNLKSGKLSLDAAKFLDERTLSKWRDEYKLRNNDILINSTGTGTVGRVGIFSEQILGNYPFIVPDSHISVVRTFSNIDSYYIYYLMCSSIIQQYIEDNLAGSTNQKELYIGVLEKLLLPLPPLSEQQRIVDTIQNIFCCIEN